MMFAINIETIRTAINVVNRIFPMLHKQWFPLALLCIVNIIINISGYSAHTKTKCNLMYTRRNLVASNNNCPALNQPRPFDVFLLS